MENPYLALHREFRPAGAELLTGSGQACVVFGIAAFSKDGDWIIREDEFNRLQAGWKAEGTPLREQHHDLMEISGQLLEKRP